MPLSIKQQTEMDSKMESARLKIRKTQPATEFVAEVVSIQRETEYIGYFDGQEVNIEYYNVQLANVYDNVRFNYFFKVERGDNLPKIGDKFNISIS